MLATFYRSEYRPTRLVGCSPETTIQYEVALGHWRRFADLRFAGRLPINEITTHTLADFQSFLLASGRAAATVNKIIRHLMAIVRMATKDQQPQKRPQVRKLREPKHSPLALTVEEFSKVVQTAKQWPRAIGGYPAAAWWLALLLVAWESGFRVSALLSVRCCDVLFDSAGLYCQAEPQKDKEAQWVWLPPHTLAAVQEIWSPERLGAHEGCPRFHRWAANRWPRQLPEVAERMVNTSAKCPARVGKGQ